MLEQKKADFILLTMDSSIYNTVKQDIYQIAFRFSFGNGSLKGETMNRQKECFRNSV